MSDYRDSLKYDVTQRNITGKRTTKTSQRYKARKAARNRAIAVVLAGAMTVGLGKFIAGKSVEKYEEKFVSNIEEIEKYNLNAQDLQLSAETYEHFMEFSEEIKEQDKNKFRDVSNNELADYFSEMEQLYLRILKEKISSVTGMTIDEFTLVAPSAHGTETYGTKIKDPLMQRGIGIALKSDDIDNYMNDILDIRDYAGQILNSDVDRDKLEAKLVQYNETLAEVATISVLREVGKKDTPQLSTYRMETKGLQQSTEYKQQEKENEK